MTTTGRVLHSLGMIEEACGWIDVATGPWGTRVALWMTLDNDPTSSAAAPPPPPPGGFANRQATVRVRGGLAAAPALVPPDCDALPSETGEPAKPPADGTPRADTQAGLGATAGVADQSGSECARETAGTGASEIAAAVAESPTLRARPATDSASSVTSSAPSSPQIQPTEGTSGRGSAPLRSPAEAPRNAASGAVDSALNVLLVDDDPVIQVCPVGAGGSLVNEGDF